MPLHKLPKQEGNIDFHLPHSSDLWEGGLPKQQSTLAIEGKGVQDCQDN